MCHIERKSSLEMKLIFLMYGVEDESGGVGITLEMFELVLFDELNVEEVVLVEHDTAEKITNSNDKNL